MSSALDSRLGIAELAAAGDGDVLAALRDRHAHAWRCDAPDVTEVPHE